MEAKIWDVQSRKNTFLVSAVADGFEKWGADRARGMKAGSGA